MIHDALKARIDGLEGGDTAGSTDNTLKLYEGHFHLLNHIDKEVVMADIKDWINRHLPAV